MAAPHVAVAHYDLQARDLLTSVFAAAPGPAAPAAWFPPLPGDHPRPWLAPPPFWKGRGRLSVLLLGGDAGPGRSGIRTDSMIVASVEPRTRRVALFGIARNLVHLHLPGIGYYEEPLNALYQDAALHPATFPGRDPGATALKIAVGHLLGTRIDHYVLVDMRGFVGVIDALGGVTIEVREGLRGRFSTPGGGKPDAVLRLAPGRYHVDGLRALAYARSRLGDNDYRRMARQRCLLGAVVREADLPTLLRAFPKLVRAAKRWVRTDIPLRLLPDLIDLAVQVKAERIVTVGFTPPRFMRPPPKERPRPGHYEPNEALIRHVVAEALSRPVKHLAAGLRVGTLGAEC